MAKRKQAKPATENPGLPELIQVLKKAETANAILAAVAYIVWRDDHFRKDGGEPDACPTGRIPTERDLIQALDQGWLQGNSTDLTWFYKSSAAHWGVTTFSPGGKKMVMNGDEPRLCAVIPRVDESRQNTEIRSTLKIQTVEQVHRDWLSPPEEERSKHPASVLVRAWQKQPVTAKANARNDPILPTRLAMVNKDDRRAGTLFSVAAHYQAETQLTLPGFGTDIDGPALPLALYDLGIGMRERGGTHAAPLALRLWVEAVLSVNRRPDGRHVYPESLEVTLRDLLRWLYPGDRRPRPNEYWTDLQVAVEVLDSTEARIPWHDPQTGKGGLRRVVSATDIPRGPGALDDVITLTVSLPPGSDIGPVINRTRLRFWGTKSAAAYRAMLNLAYRWFDPGVTRVPGLAAGAPWIQVQDPDRYEPLTNAELIDLCFPRTTAKNRRTYTKRARDRLKTLEQSGDLRIIELPDGWRILPPLPAARNR